MKPSKAENKIMDIQLPFLAVTRDIVHQYQAIAKSRGYESISFTAEPLIGPYITIGVDEKEDD